VKSRSSVIAGVVIALFGVLFMFQGLGKVKGSPMTGSNFWAIAGPAIAIAGAVLAISGARRDSSDD
jgi:hypothetical protein